MRIRIRRVARLENSKSESCFVTKAMWGKEESRNSINPSLDATTPLPSIRYHENPSTTKRRTEHPKEIHAVFQNQLCNCTTAS